MAMSADLEGCTACLGIQPPRLVHGEDVFGTS
jgi:hypothetical protein